MKDNPKEQAQNRWLIPLATILNLTTIPNLRQATFEGSIKLPISLSNNNPRGTEWQEQLFRLASERVEG